MTSTQHPSSSEQLHAEALRLDQLGAHQHAEPLFARLLAVSESRLGGDHSDIASALNDLARCRFNGGRLAAALRDYRRLLRVLRPSAGDPRIGLTRHQIRRCIDGLRQRKASAGLQRQLALLIRRGRSHRAVGENGRQERLRLLARRLIARGRVALGARLMQHWLADLLRSGQAIDAQALDDLRDHALALWNDGHAQLAAPMLRDIVHVLRHQHADEPAAWANALRDWGHCLAAAGQHRSARETLALAESVGRQAAADDARWLPANDRQARHEPAPSPRQPWLHGLMLSVLQRSSFILGLEWQGEPERLDVQVLGDSAHVGGAIRFDDGSGDWIPFGLATPAEAAPSFPHLRAWLRLPLCKFAADNPQAMLATMSRLASESPGVSVSLDAATGEVMLRSQLCFSGCMLDDVIEAVARDCLQEVSLNMVIALLCAAQDCLRDAPPAQGAGQPEGKDDEPDR